MKFQIEVIKSKIHRVTVTQADLHYVGSITIDEALLEAANIIEGEKVQIMDIDNGERFETYVIKGERGSGCICLNGAAARKVAGRNTRGRNPPDRKCMAVTARNSSITPPIRLPAA